MENKRTRDRLRRKILSSIAQQGFIVRDGRILSSVRHKSELRDIHRQAVEQKRSQSKKYLKKWEKDLLRWVANGDELVPCEISPVLVEVKPKSEHELLFRYVCLHWSIPVSSGYGRRLRFLVVDNTNQKLIGVIGIGDPVFGLKARDEWVGWGREERKKRLRNVMDLFVLGAIPPYSLLLGGKLVALLAASTEIREAVRRKYRGHVSFISQQPQDGRLALVTTTSALGRSSIYNRLNIGNERIFQSVGYTAGSGDFQFCNGVYAAIFDYVDERFKGTAKKESWGTGFRNRREVVKMCLKDLGLPTTLIYHGIGREVFVAPLARNTKEFLRGEHNRLMWNTSTVTETFGYFKERWLLSRAASRPDFRDFRRDSWSLW